MRGAWLRVRQIRAAAICLQERPLGVCRSRTSYCETRASAAGAASPPRAAIVNADLDQHIFGRCLGVLNENIEVAVLIEDAGVDQFVFRLAAAAFAIGRDEIVVRICRLRILVKILHVRMRRRAVEVVVVLLHILAMIAFAVGQAEEPFLEDRILAVPQGERKTEPLLVVRNAGKAVLAPAVGARSGLIVAEIVPGIAILAVVLADGSPLPLAQIRPPFSPGNIVDDRLRPGVFARRSWAFLSVNRADGVSTYSAQGSIPVPFDRSHRMERDHPRDCQCSAEPRICPRGRVRSIAVSDDPHRFRWLSS